MLYGDLEAAVVEVRSSPVVLKLINLVFFKVLGYLHINFKGLSVAVLAE